MGLGEFSFSALATGVEGVNAVASTSKSPGSIACKKACFGTCAIACETRSGVMISSICKKLGAIPAIGTSATGWLGVLLDPVNKDAADKAITFIAPPLKFYGAPTETQIHRFVFVQLSKLWPDAAQCNAFDNAAIFERAALPESKSVSCLCT